MNRHAIFVNKDGSKPTKVQLYRRGTLPNTVKVQTNIMYMPEGEDMFGHVKLEKKYKLKFHFDHSADTIALYEEVDA